MASLSKGKEKATEFNSSKRKYNSEDDDKSGGHKRRNRAILQFFEDSAFEVDADSSDDQHDFDVDDFLEDEFLNEVEANNERVQLALVPFIKEEEMDEAELERMVEERYGRGSSFIRYAEDGYDDREAADWDEYPPLFRDPTIWKVKCMVGREKHSVFCLMQKYVDLQPLGTKLQIISAFSLDRVKGFIYIEADRQQDLFEACKGLSNIYVSRVTPVKPDEWSYLLSERSKGCVTTAGMWARVKRGKYKGDLGQIVAVNEARKKATVKLIPRIDLQALTEKIGGGVSMKKNYIPAPPRLISSREIEQFGPLIQMRRDRDTNTTFEVLDGMMLKDGYLYKKITIDSLSVWGAMPTEDELLKFEPPNNTESMDFEFLSVLYGNDNRNKEQIMKNDKGDGKGEGSSTSNVEFSFEVHDLVFFGKKDFGVIIGMEKDDNFKIMKEGTEGPLVLTLPARDLKSASFDKKLFTAKDLHMKKISVSDRVRVMDSPLKDKEGVVKRIYKGIIFLFNESEEEHNGYTCFKSQICEKVISASQESHEQGNESGPSGLGESPSSPNSTPTPKKSWQGRENSSFNQEDKNSMFSVGQSLRIKVGPLKGYLCRVLAIRRSDVTVKLDSQQKVLTVKSKHLSEVRGKSSASVTRGDQESAKPFDLLGTTDGSRGANSRKILDGGSSRTKDGGSIWGKPTGPSWGQQVDAKAVEVHDRTKSNQSWHNQAGSSWNKQVGGSSWKGKGGGSGLNKTAGGSRGKTTSGSAWGLQAVANTEKPNTTTDQPQGIKGAGGSSTRWGKGSWGNSSTDDALEDHKSAWTSKRDWGAGIDFSERQEQAQKISRGRGRGGSSRGGRGGRGESDRDSYGVRGSSGRGGFMGRGGNFGCRDGSDQGGRGSSGLGGFRARKGSFGGRDGSDQEGRRGSGRGGLPGRGGSLGGRNGSDQDQGGRGDSGLGGFRGKGGSFGGRDGSDQGGKGGSGRGGFRGRGGSFRGRDGSAQVGRGGSGRGGFRGRDGSDQEGYGGRGRSDRGGFRGRGHSNFGGRGRGRSDQYGGNWNNINDSGEEKPTGWSKSSWRADGGKSNENKANWNQGGADSGQWKGWSTMSQSKGGVDGYARQKKSWSSGGSWSKPGNNGWVE